MEGDIICFAQMKKNTIFFNVFAMILVMVVLITATWAYMNAQMPFLLQDLDYFNIPFERTGEAANQVVFLGHALSPLFGTVYDVVREKVEADVTLQNSKLLYLFHS